MAKADFFDAVQKIYIAYYGRPADPNGLDFWAGKIDAAQGKIEEVLTAFGSSAEAASLFGAGSTESKVNNIFQQVLGRQADPAGLNFYTQALNNGTLNGKPFTLVNVAQAILDGATGTDATTVANKLASAKLFTAAIDTTPEILAYSGNAAAATARGFLANVTATPADAAAANASVASIVAANNSVTGQTLNLTVGVDNLIGGAANDTFRARLNGANETLQNGDILAGGAGTDTLVADLARNANTGFAISPESTGIEEVYFRIQTETNDSNDNNLNGIAIDAEDIVGETLYGTVDSRADLRIEDVRIENNQITRDITLVMRNTDPATVPAPNAIGGVNGGGVQNVAAAGLEVYFDPQALRAQAPVVAGAQLNVRILDQAGFAAQGAAGALANDVFNGFTFTLTTNGTPQLFTVSSADIIGATTYPALLAAVQAAIAAQPALAGRITATLGAQFTRLIGAGGTATGTTITLTDSQGGSFTTGGFTIPGNTAPPNDTLAEQDTIPPNVAAQLITSRIILDNAGRSSETGDLIVGSMSTRGGVEQFDITVQRDSWLTQASSTNNALQVVNVVNDAAVTPAGYLYLGSNSDRDLSFGSAPNFGRTPSSGDFTFVNTNGLTDVLTFNASTMTGAVRVGATITDNVLAKYSNLTDRAPNAAGVDNVQFAYTTGSGNDSVNLQISNGAASESNNKTGREDFNFNVSTNGGDDNVQLVVASGAGDTAGINFGVNGTAVTYQNQHLFTNYNVAQASQTANIQINTGDGRDVVNFVGGGDGIVRTGAGNDTVYSDNGDRQVGINVTAPNNTAGNPTATPINATYVLNAARDANGASLVAANNNGTASDDINNILSDANRSLVYTTTNGETVRVQVTFRGYTVFADVQAVSASAATALIPANATINNLAVNQAIKQAINTDRVMADLLAAQDGPANTLILSSLIQGNYDDTDLVIQLNLVAPISAVNVAGRNESLTAADLTANLNGVNAAATLTQFTQAYTSEAAVGGKAAAQDLLASQAANDITGADFNDTVGDRLIVDGAGNDVYVLSRTSNGALNGTELDDSNDTIVFAANSGVDTILNFVTGASTTAGATLQGVDRFDFRALGGDLNTDINGVATNFSNAVDGVADALASAGYNLRNQSISLVDLNTTSPEGANVVINNSTAANVARFFNTASDDAVNGVLTSTTHVVFVVGRNLEAAVAPNVNGGANPAGAVDVFARDPNVADVYSVVDTDGANAVATLIGTINLADGFALSNVAGVNTDVASSWSNMTAANFL